MRLQFIQVGLVPAQNSWENEWNWDYHVELFLWEAKRRNTHVDVFFHSSHWLQSIYNQTRRIHYGLTSPNLSSLINPKNLGPTSVSPTKTEVCYLGILGLKPKFIPNQRRPDLTDKHMPCHASPSPVISTCRFYFRPLSIGCSTASLSRRTTKQK